MIVFVGNQASNARVSDTKAHRELAEQYKVDYAAAQDDARREAVNAAFLGVHKEIMARMNATHAESEKLFQKGVAEATTPQALHELIVMRCSETVQHLNDVLDGVESTDFEVDAPLVRTEATSDYTIKTDVGILGYTDVGSADTKYDMVIPDDVQKQLEAAAPTATPRPPKVRPKAKTEPVAKKAPVKVEQRESKADVRQRIAATFKQLRGTMDINYVTQDAKVKQELIMRSEDANHLPALVRVIPLLTYYRADDGTRRWLEEQYASLDK